MSAAPKVTDDQIRELRSKRESGALLKELSAEFGLTLNYVCSLCKFRERKKVKATP